MSRNSKGAIAIETGAAPCPWPIGSCLAAVHRTTIQNGWAVSIDNIEIYIRPQNRIVRRPKVKLTHFSVASGGMGAIDTSLEPRPSRVGTEKILTAVAFNDATQRSGIDLNLKHNLTTEFTIDLL